MLEVGELGTRKKNRKARLVPTREPSGRHSRSGGNPDRAPHPAQVVRLRDAVLAGLTDARWGSVIGQLYLRGDLTAEQYSAGCWWLEMVSRYHGALLVPRQARSVALDGGRGGEPPDPDSEAGARISRREASAIERFLDAHGALIEATIKTRLPVEATVRQVCEHDTWPAGTAETMALSTGLNVLFAQRTLTNRRK